MVGANHTYARMKMFRMAPAKALLLATAVSVSEKRVPPPKITPERSF
jgi:hypothetical protein